MKQFPCVIITACSLLVSVISHAQIKQGEKMLGGNFSYSSANDKTDADNSEFKTSKFNFTPQLGFGLSNNWIFGIQAGYTSTNENQDAEPEDYKYEASTFSVGVFGRKWKSFNEHVGIFGQGTVELAFGKVKNNFPSDGFDGEDKTSGFSVHVRPGLYVIPAKKIILEATFGQLGYSSVKSTNDEYDDYERKQNEFGLSFVDGLSFGIKLIL